MTTSEVTTAEIPKPLVHIEDWWIRQGRLHGKVLDHPMFGAGEIITSFPLIGDYVGAVEGSSVETSNVIYRLGKEKD